MANICALTVGVILNMSMIRLLAQANNLAGADCIKIFVLLQRLLAAAQPERYTSNHFDLNLELAQREAEGVSVVCPWDPNFD